MQNVNSRRLMGYYTVLTGKYYKTPRTDSKSPRNLDPEDGGTTILRIVVKYLPVDTNLQRHRCGQIKSQIKR